MKTFELLLAEYGFEDYRDFMKTLEEGQRGGENGLFFENAIQLIEELRNEYGKLQEHNSYLKEQLKEAKEYFKSDFRYFNQL